MTEIAVWKCAFAYSLSIDLFAYNSSYRSHILHTRVPACVLYFTNNNKVIYPFLRVPAMENR